MLNYYNQKQIIAKLDKEGNVIGQIEKWKAHKEGVLHKALTVTLIYNGKFVVQKRKHPAFDKTLDITSSSHQLFIDGSLQKTEEAVYDCLKREWNLKREEVKNLEGHGSIYYKAKDPNSIYTEHEICEILTAEITKEPTTNLDFAYGYLLITKADLLNKESEMYKNLAPWVLKMIEEDKI